MNDHEEIAPRLSGSLLRRRFLLLLSLLRGFPEPVALAVHLEDRAAVGEPVQQRRGHAFALEDLSPLAERQVARDQDAAAFVPVGEDLEQQLHPRAAEADIAQLVHDQQVDLLKHRQHPLQPVVLLCFLELVHQRLSRGELHAPTRSARGLAQCDRKVGLTGAAVADQCRVIVLIDPLAARQFQNLLLVHARHEREVERLQVFQYRERRRLQACRQRVGGSLGHFQFGQLQQVIVVPLIRLRRLTQQLDVLRQYRRQAQCLEVVLQ